MRRNLFKLSLITFLSLLTYIYTSSSLALSVFTISLWITEALPLPVTALLVPVLATLLGILTPEKAASAFGNDIIFLFIGVFFISKAAALSGLTQRIANSLLRLPTRSTPIFIFAILFTTWAMSMLFSNTATVALMLPIILGLSNEFKDENLTKRLLIGASFAASFGGMATPVGTPPNAIAVGFLESKGIAINFLDWVLVGLPFSLLMLLVSYTVLCFFFPLKAETCLISKQATKIAPIKFEEKVVILSLLIALILWLLPSFTNLKIPLGTAAILAVIPLFLLRTLPWDQAKEIDWGTVVLFGGGLTLGSVIEVSGITNSLNLGFQSEFIMLMVVVGTCILLSEVGSNTASAAILIPLFYSIAPDSTILIALACSFGFMLPVSTPPNAIIYGTGQVPLRAMLKTGVIVDLLGVVLLASYFYFLAVPG